jgi:hypothetical protein
MRKLLDITVVQLDEDNDEITITNNTTAVDDSKVFRLILNRETHINYDPIAGEPEPIQDWIRRICTNIFPPWDCFELEDE